MAINFSGATPHPVPNNQAVRFGEARRTSKTATAKDSVQFGSGNQDQKKAEKKNAIASALKWAALGIPLAPLTALAVFIGTLIIPPPGANVVLSCGSFFLSPLIWGTMGYLKAKAHNLKVGKGA